MNDIDDAIWEFITDAIGDASVKVVIGNSDTPRPSEFPYIAFFTTETPSENWDSFQYDGDTETMTQVINTEYLVDIKGTGEGAKELLFKIYAAAGFSEAQETLRSRSFVIYNRDAPSKRPYVLEAETVPGADMALRIRGHEKIEHQIYRIESAEIKGALKADSGNEIEIKTTA